MYTHTNSVTTWRWLMTHMLSVSSLLLLILVSLDDLVLTMPLSTSGTSSPSSTYAGEQVGQWHTHTHTHTHTHLISPSTTCSTCSYRTENPLPQYTYTCVHWPVYYQSVPDTIWLISMSTHNRTLWKWEVIAIQYHVLSSGGIGYNVLYTIIIIMHQVFKDFLKPVRVRKSSDKQRCHLESTFPSNKNCRALPSDNSKSVLYTFAHNTIMHVYIQLDLLVGIT